MPCLSPVAIIRVGVTTRPTLLVPVTAYRCISAASVHHDVSPGGAGGAMASYEAIFEGWGAPAQRMEVAN